MASRLELGNDPKLLENESTKEEEEEEEESFSFAMQLVFSTVLSMSLQTAIELGVFNIIAKAGEGAKLSPLEISLQMAANNSEAPIMLDRILRVLASHSVLRCTVVGDHNDESDCQRFYGLSPVSKHFVTNGDGVSLGPLMALVQDKIFLASWPHLKDSVLEGGIAFNKVYGTHAFEYPGLDPRFNDVFNKAMYNQTTIVIKRILKRYKGFDNIKQLVDVGGGLGVSLKLITSKYPHIKGINFDLPHVIEHAPSYPGVEHQAGDMFEKVPCGDAVFMKWILHDWSDELCLKLLKNCYKAIPENGKIIVLEAILPVEPGTNSAVKSTSEIDVFMMTQNPGGKERSAQQFRTLAISAGFGGIKFECFVCNFWVMELFK